MLRIDRVVAIKKFSVAKGGFLTAVFFGYFEEWKKISFFGGGFFSGIEGQNFNGRGSLFIVALV